MAVNPNVAEVASLLGEPSRATILTSLMDGRFIQQVNWHIWLQLNHRRPAFILQNWRRAIL